MQLNFMQVTTRYHAKQHQSHQHTVVATGHVVVALTQQQLVLMGNRT